jgi:stearoyl-CoA desaturase (delta-9 desaturase)
MSTALAAAGVETVLQTPRTLKSDRLRRLQHGHAILVLALMLIGLATLGILWVNGHPPRACELLVFAGMTALVGIGSSAGYHRHFTHRSFKATPAVRVTLAILGSMAMQGSVLFWVALHRRHHENADGPGDPHSPYYREDGGEHRSRRAGIWHSYLGWTVRHDVPNTYHYARDLIRDRAISLINRTYPLWVLLGLLVPGAVVFAVERSWLGFITGIVWGGLIRILVWHHAIWYITSLAHVWGSRDYACSDLSTNNGWLSVLTLGESWHNNHHAFPTAAVLSFRWYQFDPAGLVILSLQKMGWVWDARIPPKEDRLSKASRART